MLTVAKKINDRVAREDEPYAEGTITYVLNAGESYVQYIVHWDDEEYEDVYFSNDELAEVLHCQTSHCAHLATRK